MAYGYGSNPGPDPGDESDMDSLYGDEGKGDMGKGKSVDEEEQEDMQETAMVPLKVLQGKHTDEPLKEGDEVVLKVLHVHDTQAEVAYSETPPGEIGKEGGGRKDMEHGSYEEELDEMGKEG